VRVEAERDNVIVLSMTPQECSALIAAARLALDVMEDDERAPAAARRLLRRTLDSYDAAIGRPA
jgi:hypothetical protein